MYKNVPAEIWFEDQNPEDLMEEKVLKNKWKEEAAEAMP